MAFSIRPIQSRAWPARRLRDTAGLTIIELMISLSIIAVISAVMLPALGRAREAALRAHCMNNMRELGRLFQMHAADHKYAYPPGAPNHAWGGAPTEATRPFRLIRNNYTIDPRSLDGYITEYKVFACRAARLDFPYDYDYWFADVSFTKEHLDPQIGAKAAFKAKRKDLAKPLPDPECLSSEMYFYVPYTVASEGEMVYLLNELDARMAAGETNFMRDDLPCSVPGQGTAGRNSFLRVTDGVERMFITDVNNPAASWTSQSQIPVLFDRASHGGRLGFNHAAALGGNVLYMDGSVAFVRYAEGQGRIPYTADLVEWMRRNAYNNRTLENIPPWCANRAPGTAFEPRYKYYPSDPRYADLVS